VESLLFQGLLGIFEWGMMSGGLKEVHNQVDNNKRGLVLGM